MNVFYSKKKVTRDSSKTNFEDKVYNQIGALCYRIANKKIKILLITSRRSKRWIMPKGWKIDKMSKSTFYFIITILSFVEKLQISIIFKFIADLTIEYLLLLDPVNSNLFSSISALVK